MSANQPLVVTSDLTKRFGNGVYGAKKISFTTYKGEIFGLLGPNGAGKTTTIRLIATVLRPTSGTASVAGFDIIKQSVSVRRNIGLLTTDIGVYDRFSGRENLAYFGQLYGLFGPALKKRIEELARMLDMKEYLDRRAGTYSTGMKQKLAIARSVIHDPDVIILDEPTSGLDVLAVQTVLEFMRESRRRGKCVIFSTHHMHDAERMCDRVAIIHRSKLVVTDTVKNILQSTKKENLEDAFLTIVKRKGMSLEPAPQPAKVTK